jgi:hypothetical protein
MKIAVIVDNRKVKRFGLLALDALQGVEELTVFSCTNTRSRKRWFRHVAYYALNLFTIRNRLTRSVAVNAGKNGISRFVDFASAYDGAWQELPPQIVAQLNAGGFDVILKFGMGLLRVPTQDDLPIPILSFHHGDPDMYRGRPAGFWEIVDGAEVMGQVVQIIGNRLDAGQVVAFAETKIYPWSYRKTLIEAYDHSPLLINAAIRNALAPRYLPKRRGGKNCRLPTNGTVIAFVASMAWRLARRLAYGALVEKRWRVSLASLAPAQLADVIEGRSFPSADEWRTPAVDPRYRFYADPFFVDGSSEILVEAVSSRSGLGEILILSGSGHRSLIREGGHLSYPATARIDGRRFVMPECASWSGPRLYEIKDGEARFAFALQIEGDARLVDPTLFEWEGRIYLFGNIPDLGRNALYLWSSMSIEDCFVLHPASPVRISPKGSRMGGGLTAVGSRLIRFGQDYSRGYGDGLIAFEVEELTPTRYRERAVGEIRIAGRRGPHTANLASGEMVFDWYADRFSPFAGVRRLAAYSSVLLPSLGRIFRINRERGRIVDPPSTVPAVTVKRQSAKGGRLNVL